ncbi:endopeptidase IV [Legionella sp. 27cVA30]|uniref:endopeptidase IV n=1 Tax=Legionella sp. 27cVA30 TaxID=2905657 RepID=UPI00209FABD8|nr:endopeptidase IV [Legionella sp. 27cVA30]MCP0914095.1 endopeptidase IV [Legionella sp. 27cVA30]
MKKIKTIMRNATLPLLLCVCGISLAQAAAPSAPKKEKPNEERQNPLGCRDVGYQFELKVLELLPEAAGERNSLYFILNKLDKPINLYQMRSNDSARSMYLNHVIQGNQWAVLSTCEKNLKYICTVNEGKSPYGKIVDCGESLQVCEYARVRFGLNNRGNYWVVKSTNRSGAVREVVHYGIIPQ